ncbi:MAG: prepilin peptidase [bacterium]
MSIILFIFGSCLGSFFNVCIYRIPRGKSIVMPPSACPKCKHRIMWYDNIPILSYLLLKAKCRFCGEKISIIYPVVELLTAIVFLVTYLKFGLSAKLVIYLILFSLFIIIGFIDADTETIPDVLSIPGIIIGLGTSFFTIGIKSSLLGMLVGAGVIGFFIGFWLLVFKKEGMGMGDLMLMAMIGSFTGWVSALYTIFYGSIIGLVFAASLHKKSLQDKLYFGPALVIASFLIIMFGKNILIL